MFLRKPYSHFEHNYRMHRDASRFLYVLGRGIEQVADDHAKKIIQANQAIGKELKETMETGFEGVYQGQREIHEALVFQTDVIQSGFIGLELKLDEGFTQTVRGLNEIAGRVDNVGLVISEESRAIRQGIGGLKASFDMGMAGLVSQFEMERQEIRRGFEQLSEILRNRFKTDAQERFRDGKQAYEQYLAHPEEPQFLFDAQSFFTESLTAYRSNPFTHLYLGHIHQEPDGPFDLEKSKEHYRLCATYAKGLENHELTALGFFLAAWIAYVLGEFAQAVEWGLASENYSPQGIPENTFNLARAYANLPEPAPAVEYLEKAIRKFDPEYALKADMDGDFDPVREDVNALFVRLREEEAAFYQKALQNLGPSLLQAPANFSVISASGRG